MGQRFPHVDRSAAIAYRSISSIPIDYGAQRLRPVPARAAQHLYLGKQSQTARQRRAASAAAPGDLAAAKEGAIAAPPHEATKSRTTTFSEFSWPLGCSWPCGVAVKVQGYKSKGCQGKGYKGTKVKGECECECECEW